MAFPTASDLQEGSGDKTISSDKLWCALFRVLNPSHQSIRLFLLGFLLCSKDKTTFVISMYIFNSKLSDGLFREQCIFHIQDGGH